MADPEGNADTLPAARSGAGDGVAAEAELPRYPRVRALGQGGMGRVDQARDRDLLRDVAVKALRAELRDDPRLTAQFVWEARVTAHLDHPGIVPVYDVGQTAAGHRFFTMKLVRGQTLDARLARLRAGAGTVAADGLHGRLRTFLQLCQAAAFAHARGVLHRDLKPANVMVGEYGEVMITDWGLAVALAEADPALRALMPTELAAESVGTPSYMSPEQVRGEPLDARSDLYALGVILYELIALRRAFDAPSLPLLRAMVEAGEAPPLAEVCPGVSPALAAVVAKAMAVDPQTRYADARDLAADVETVLDGRTPSAEQASALTQAARFYVSHDPGMARLRVIDIDFWVLAGMLMGAGAGARLAGWLRPFWWGLVAAGCLVSLPSMVRWLRLRRRQSDREAGR